MSKLVIGFITYGRSTAKYLPYFLDSLKKQTYKDFDTIVIDNTDDEENDNRSYIKKNYPAIEFKWGGGNMGFSRAYNKIIKKAINRNASLFLMLNPDMILKEDAIEKMVSVMEGNGSLGSVSPKIFKWDFKNKEKTDIIDSCGIKLNPGLNFIDMCQGRPDKESCCSVRPVGPSGAAGMYRISALEKIKENNKYFEELMFMYKEDCDLIYRLFLAGFKSDCVRDAIIYHDRTATSGGESYLDIIKNRKGRNKNIKAWSFLNQQIIFMKYWKLQSFYNKLKIVWYQIRAIVFIVLFERFLLKELVNLFKIRGKIKSHKID
jgi:GT2 family glycosyltransferase